MTLSVDDVVAKYVELRDLKAEIEGEAKERTDKIRVQMGRLEGWLKDKADEMGVTSFKTAKGTAFVTTTDYAQVGDWDTVMKFIKDNEAFHMLEHRVSKNAVRDYMKTHGAVPPGVNYGTKIGVNVRRPSASAD